MTLALILSGCSLYGPVYKKPNVTLLPEWKSADHLSDESHLNLPMMAWWQKFDDKQLTYLINKAVANNNNIQVAAGHVMDARLSP
jgi:outer membrane protein, multidrug efflux system